MAQQPPLVPNGGQSVTVRGLRICLKHLRFRVQRLDRKTRKLASIMHCMHRHHIYLAKLLQLNYDESELPGENSDGPLFVCKQYDLAVALSLADGWVMVLQTMIQVQYKSLWSLKIKNAAMEEKLILRESPDPESEIPEELPPHREQKVQTQQVFSRRSYTELLALGFSSLQLLAPLETPFLRTSSNLKRSHDDISTEAVTETTCLHLAKRNKASPRCVVHIVPTEILLLIANRLVYTPFAHVYFLEALLFPLLPVLDIIEQRAQQDPYLDEARKWLLYRLTQYPVQFKFFLPRFPASAITASVLGGLYSQLPASKPGLRMLQKHLEKHEGNRGNNIFWTTLVSLNRRIETGDDYTWLLSILGRPSLDMEETVIFNLLQGLKVYPMNWSMMGEKKKKFAAPEGYTPYLETHRLAQALQRLLVLGVFGMFRKRQNRGIIIKDQEAAKLVDMLLKWGK